MLHSKQNYRYNNNKIEYGKLQWQKNIFMVLIDLSHLKFFSPSVFLLVSVPFILITFRGKSRPGMTGEYGIVRGGFEVKCSGRRF